MLPAGGGVVGGGVVGVLAGPRVHVQRHAAVGRDARGERAAGDRDHAAGAGAGRRVNVPRATLQYVPSGRLVANVRVQALPVALNAA